MVKQSEQVQQARGPLWILTSTYELVTVPCQRVSGCIQAHEGASKSVIWSGDIPKHASSKMVYQSENVKLTSVEMLK